MPTVRPFTGLLYDPAVAGPFPDVTAPPYDAISPVDRDRYYRASPYNVVRLILGKREAGDDASNNEYTRAASHLRSWRSEGALRPTHGPALYPYEVRFQLDGRPRRLRGLIAEVGLEPWGGAIIPHERTMSGPIGDRLTLLRTVRANLSPVYAVIPGPGPQLNEFLDASTTSLPDREVVDESGTTHRLWVAEDEGGAVAGMLSRERLMIADGHHRYTVALAYREQMHARFGPGPWDSMMMLVVDASREDPPVLPIHRVLMGPANEYRPVGDRVRDMAEILVSVSDDELTYGTVEAEEEEPVHRVARLDGAPPTVCALHEQVLDGLRSGVDESRMQFVPDSVAAERAVLSGEGSVAFVLPKTTFQRVWSVVLGGSKLPQKSTYFWPKPRTGMVIRPHDH